MTVLFVKNISDSCSELFSVDKDNSLSESARLKDLLDKVNLSSRLTLVLKLLNVSEL